MRQQATAIERAAARRVAGDDYTQPGMDTRSVRAWMWRIEMDYRERKMPYRLRRVMDMLYIALDEIDILRGDVPPEPTE